jgi:glycerol kinase
MKWLLNNIQSVKEKASEGTARFGTVDSWIIYVNLLLVNHRNSPEESITEHTSLMLLMQVERCS